jgi:hypothetical protein
MGLGAAILQLRMDFLLICLYLAMFMDFLLPLVSTYVEGQDSSVVEDILYLGLRPRLS